MNTADELAKLAQLRDQGVLTEDEFQAQKAAVLRGEQPTGTTAASAAPVKKGGAGKGCLVLIAIIVVLGIIGAIVGGGSSNNDTAPAASAAPPTPVTANELFKAYQANEAAAQQQYGDRRLLVSGTVASIDLDLTNDPVVQLVTDNQFMSASANLTDTSKPKASGLSKGQAVTLLCASVGEVMGSPQLRDCEIQ